MSTATKREPIRPGETLLLSDFLTRTKLGRAAWRTIRVGCEERGIAIVTYAARQAYVSTDAWLLYLQQCGATSHKATQARQSR